MDTEGRWLSYGELAAIRGTKRASAVKLAQRERWPRQAGNDRSQTIRVLVPGEWLVSARDRPAEPQDGMLHGADGMSQGFTRMLEVAARRADEANRRADVALALVADANARADRGEARAAAAEERAEQARAAAQAAEERAAGLTRADDARRAKGRLRRAWDGWRGR
jgi:hypothetical protein